MSFWEVGVRRYLYLIGFILCIVALPIALNAQDDELPSLRGRTILVGVENDYPPFNFLADDGETVGWDYDTVFEICERINCAPTFTQTAWEEIIVGVGANEIDVAANGISLSDSGLEAIEFSIGYAEVTDVLLAQSGETRFSTMDEFTEGDFVIGAKLRTVEYTIMQGTVGDNRIVGFSDTGLMIDALIEGTIDAIIVADVVGRHYSTEFENDLILIDDDISLPRNLRFVFPAGSELSSAFDEAIVSMINDGTMETINERWGFVVQEESNAEVTPEIDED